MQRELLEAGNAGRTEPTCLHHCLICSPTSFLAWKTKQTRQSTCATAAGALAQRRAVGFASETLSHQPLKNSEKANRRQSARQWLADDKIPRQRMSSISDSCFRSATCRMTVARVCAVACVCFATLSSGQSYIPLNLAVGCCRHHGSADHALL